MEESEKLKNIIEVANDLCNEMIRNNQKSIDGLKLAYPHYWHLMWEYAAGFYLLNTTMHLLSEKPLTEEKVKKVAHAVIDLCSESTDWKTMFEKEEQQNKEDNTDADA